MLLFLATIASYAQNVTGGLEHRVLHLNHIGREYKFTTEDHTVTYLRYLGEVHTLKGNSYKVLTSIWIWRLSHRATSRILIFTHENKYVGNYYIITKDEIPDRINDNQLIFLNKDGDCKPKTITYIDFSKGIPELLYNECAGNVYKFDKD
jgi:hypothetical protein